MATMAFEERPAATLAPDRFERVLSIAAIVLLAAAGIAILRGAAEWALVPPLVWGHLLTVLVAVGLTPVMLLRRRGDRRHRVLGTIWVAAMILTAASSLGIDAAGPRRFGLIHILSVWTLIQVPIIWWSARTHRIVRHRRAVRGMVTGALVIAGFFTFPFDRMLGNWLFG